MLNKVKAFDSLISIGTFNEFIESIFSMSEKQFSSYVCFTNVHMLIEAFKNRSFREILNEADIAAPDGRPVSLFIKWHYGMEQDRVAGMDLLPVLLSEAERRNKKVFFYGSTEYVLAKIKERIKLEFPSLRIVGAYSPPFRALTKEEDQEIVNLINLAEPDLVFVALGCPKQELWMASHKSKIHACMLGVGQAFLVFAGLEKRLPKWARDFALEWVYRLYLEPKRLWKRYLISNSLFVLLFVRSIFHKLMRQKDK